MYLLIVEFIVIFFNFIFWEDCKYMALLNKIIEVSYLLCFYSIRILQDCWYIKRHDVNFFDTQFILYSMLYLFILTFYPILVFYL